MLHVVATAWTRRKELVDIVFRLRHYCPLLTITYLMILKYNHINPRIHKYLLNRSSYATMGNAQSQGQRPPFRPTSNGVYDGPLFGGHHAGDFSLAVCPLSSPPSIPFGHDDPPDICYEMDLIDRDNPL